MNIAMLINMASEAYKKFLESEAERNPLKIGGSMISWENRGERTNSTQPSDILDSIYLGKDMQDTVVMDRRVASMLQDRIAGLEKENENLSSRIKRMRIIAVGLLATLALISWILLNLIFTKTFL